MSKISSQVFIVSPVMQRLLITLAVLWISRKLQRELSVLV